MMPFSNLKNARLYLIWNVTAESSVHGGYISHRIRNFWFCCLCNHVRFLCWWYRRCVLYPPKIIKKPSAIPHQFSKSKIMRVDLDGLVHLLFLWCQQLFYRTFSGVVTEHISFGKPEKYSDGVWLWKITI